MTTALLVLFGAVVLLGSLAIAACMRSSQISQAAERRPVRVSQLAAALDDLTIPELDLIAERICERQRAAHALRVREAVERVIRESVVAR